MLAWAPIRMWPQWSSPCITLEVARWQFVPRLVRKRNSAIRSVYFLGPVWVCVGQNSGSLEKTQKNPSKIYNGRVIIPKQLLIDFWFTVTVCGKQTKSNLFQTTAILSAQVPRVACAPTSKRSGSTNKQPPFCRCRASCWNSQPF